MKSRFLISNIKRDEIEIKKIRIYSTSKSKTFKFILLLIQFSNFILINLNSEI